ncbi:Uncharacterised protein [Klebsiella variicola]|nr:Uncharacterised protein [Klebsiella variicola]
MLYTIRNYLDIIIILHYNQAEKADIAKEKGRLEKKVLKINLMVK